MYHFKYHINKNDHFPVMFIISVISGLLSSMYIYSDKLSDVSIGINDLYMAILMTGWMFLLMGLYNKNISYFFIGFFIVISSLYLIRKQKFVSINQYIGSMIPHHSMAVFMTKKLKENNPYLADDLNELTNKIIKNQENEILIMKKIQKNM